ncbi:hypothetical protein AK812_SmicGene28669 [Symbiodinium microadriaticum]|uniref:Uncharacterized protein n=1 Tax=Symbiodinium microadriaticum TaxID=2951 RepID=A0A1Q9D3X2_SYMMI|nr:hypothetical protein AK812_SmicGene28669 [Symbiodinium microadriaticum]
MTIIEEQQREQEQERQQGKEQKREQEQADSMIITMLPSKDLHGPFRVKSLVLRTQKAVVPPKEALLAWEVRTFVDYQGRFQAGEEQSISILPLSFWQCGEVYQLGGNYGGKQCNVSGRLEPITREALGAQTTKNRVTHRDFLQKGPCTSAL